MNTGEQRFNKQYPIRSMIIGGVVVFIIGLFLASLWPWNKPSIKEVVNTKDNRVTTDYSIINNYFLTRTGDAVVVPEDGKIDAVTIIRGEGKVVKLPDGSWAVKFNVPKNQEFHFKAVSGETVKVNLNYKPIYFKLLEFFSNQSKKSSK